MVVLLSLGAVINYVDRGNLSLAVPSLMREFGISPAGVGVLLSAFFWTYGILQIPAGYIVDRLDLKRNYGAAFLVWSLSSAAIGLSHSFAQLLTLRIILGIAEAIAVPASLAYIKRSFAPQEQGWPTGIFTSGMILGPAIGSFIGGVLLQHHGWRFLFLSTGLGGCLWLLPWFYLAPSEDGEMADQRVKPRQTAVRWTDLFKLKLTWVIAMGSFFYAYYWYFCLTWLPSYLVMARGFSSFRMGAFTATPFLIMGLVTPLAGRGADFWIATGRPAVLVRRAFICSGFGLGSTVIGVLLTKNSTALLVVLSLSFFGLGLASANFWAFTQTICPSSIIGTAIGFQNMVANLAGACAPILTGWLIGETNSFSLAIIIAGACLLSASATFGLFVSKSDTGAIHAWFENERPAAATSHAD
jgi:ACS family D-galactonate transporter-like MFS transporter